MDTNHRPIWSEFEPCSPDANGYCYRDAIHFNKFMWYVSRILIRKHGPYIDRIPYFVQSIIWFSIGTLTAISFLALGVWYAFSMLIIFYVLLSWHSLRTKHFIKTIIQNRFCFNCGYSLCKTPTDENGYGKCSECEGHFNLGDYRQLPQGYKRPLGDVVLPDWTEAVHPLDRARMQRYESIQSTEDESQTSDT